MVQKHEVNERAKAEEVLRRLDEKEKKQHQKQVNETAKKAREWRNKGILGLLYIVDKEGGGRWLKRAQKLNLQADFLLDCPAPAYGGSRWRNEICPT